MDAKRWASTIRETSARSGFTLFESLGLVAVAKDSRATLCHSVRMHDPVLTAIRSEDISEALGASQAYYDEHEELRELLDDVC